VGQDRREGSDQGGREGRGRYVVGGIGQEGRKRERRREEGEIVG